MLIHSTDYCHGEVYLDITDRSKIYLSPSISARGISGSIHVLNNKGNNQLKFVCGRCKEELKIPQLSFICSACDNTFPVSEGKIPRNSGGVYCSQHIRRFERDGESSLSLISVLESNSIIFER